VLTGALSSFGSLRVLLVVGVATIFKVDVKSLLFQVAKKLVGKRKVKSGNMDKRKTRQPVADHPNPTPPTKAEAQATRGMNEALDEVMKEENVGLTAIAGTAESALKKESEELDRLRKAYSQVLQ